MHVNTAYLFLLMESDYENNKSFTCTKCGKGVARKDKLAILIHTLYIIYNFFSRTATFSVQLYMADQLALTALEMYIGLILTSL